MYYLKIELIYSFFQLFYTISLIFKVTFIFYIVVDLKIDDY